MTQSVRHKANTKAKKLKPHIFVLAMYFFIAPLEDVFTTSYGTLAKYLMYAFLLFAFIELHKTKANIVDKESTSLYVPVLLLIALAWLSTFWSIYQEMTIGRNSAYTTLPLIFCMLTLLSFNEQDFNLIKTFAFFSGILTLIFLFYTQGTDIIFKGRLTLTENNDPNNQAALLMLPFAISIERIMIEKKLLIKAVYGVFAFLFLFITLLTGSRGGLLSIAVFIITYLFFIVRKEKYKYIFIMIALLLLMGILAYNLLPEHLVQRLFTEESYQSAATSSGQRMVIWENTIKYVFPTMPLIGYGSGSPPYVLSEFYGKIKAMHNTFLNMIVEYGVLGLPIFLVFLYRLLKRLLSRNKGFELAILLGMICTIFFLDSYAKKFFWNVLYFVIISLRTRTVKENN